MDSSDELDKKIDEAMQDSEDKISKFKGVYDYNAKLDKYGFPIISFSKKKKED
ncbi:hypothetical protein [Helicobacter sp. 13S00477-4]|uniref:hypothetical protein n=1 Tax=Helicobacter sp. 13S00477-4 TaxID=1905759 RepID=UPI0015D9A7D6|nr:hypothetical protein [Helicobacter sp. 13S00477-4]